MSREAAGRNRILVIQTAFPGDLILTTPLLESLHEYYQNHEIHLLIDESGESLFRDHPFLHSVILYRKRSKRHDWREFIKITRGLRSYRFDIAYIPHRSFRSALIATLAGIPERIGFAGTPGSPLLTRKIARNQDQHEIFRNLSLFEVETGEQSKFCKPVLYPSEKDRSFVTGELSQLGISSGEAYICLAPGSVWPTKRWPEQYWSTLAGQISDELGMTVLLIGGKEDYELAESIRNHAGKKVWNVAGKFDFLQSSVLLENSHLLITNDSAPLHLASAAGTVVFAIFGPTVPEFGFAPVGEQDRIFSLDLDCRPCAIHGGMKCPLDHHRCMKDFTPDQLIPWVRELIEMKKEKSDERNS